MRRALPILSAAALVAGFAGCGGSDAGGSSGTMSAPASATTAAPAAKQVTVNIASFKYAPPKLTVAKGAKVTFVNQDKAPHTATARNSAFDTATLDQGDRKALTLDKPGRYEYTCSFHAFMEGEIVVK